MTPSTQRPPYDGNNIFARILRGEIPCQEVASSSHSLAFRDVSPQAPVHVLVIPREAYVDLADFSAHASDEEITDFFRLAGEVAAREGLTTGGFRAIVNVGEDGGQEVPHCHLHLLGGKSLGPMLAR